MITAQHGECYTVNCKKSGQSRRLGNLPGSGISGMYNRVIFIRLACPIAVAVPYQCARDLNSAMNALQQRGEGGRWRQK